MSLLNRETFEFSYFFDIGNRLFTYWFSRCAMHSYKHIYNRNQRLGTYLESELSKDGRKGWMGQGGREIEVVGSRAYRHNIKRSIEVAIGASVQCKSTPKVDLEVLDRFSGGGWTAIYKGDAEGSSRT